MAWNISKVKAAAEEMQRISEKYNLPTTKKKKKSKTTKKDRLASNA